MEEVIIAAGSNLGDRLAYLQKAGKFLGELSAGTITKSSVWESEAVGGAKYTFLNSAARIKSNLPPGVLLAELKRFEAECGRRDQQLKRWGPRVIDLDIICYGNLVIQQENLIIPHPEYQNRLFVLLPMHQIAAGWKDHSTGKTIEELIHQAPQIEIHQTRYNW